MSMLCWKIATGNLSRLLIQCWMGTFSALRHLPPGTGWDSLLYCVYSKVAIRAASSDLQCWTPIANYIDTVWRGERLWEETALRTTWRRTCSFQKRAVQAFRGARSRLGTRGTEQTPLPAPPPPRPRLTPRGAAGRARAAAAPGRAGRDSRAGRAEPGPRPRPALATRVAGTRCYRRRGKHPPSWPFFSSSMPSKASQPVRDTLSGTCLTELSIFAMRNSL